MTTTRDLMQDVLAEDMNMAKRLDQLVRAGLMAPQALPTLHRGLSKLNAGMAITGQDRDAVTNLLNSLLFIVLGDDTMFQKSQTTVRQNKQEHGHNVATHMAMEAKKDPGEYDYEGDMAMSQLKSIMMNAKRLHDCLEPETNLPEWVQSKITLAEDYITTATNYVEGTLDEEVEITEVLSKDASAGDWIHDFVHSDNPQFKGKSEKKRKQMALGAYYAKQRNEEVEEIDEGRPSQRHPLEGHEYHKKSDAALIHIAKDAHAAAEAMKSHNTTAENKYRDQANDSATVRHFRKTSGMPTWYKKKYGHIKESDMSEVEQVNEKASDKEVKMATGIPHDKRYVGGNMTGAISAIEKIRRGLSKHPRVAASLKAANEATKLYKDLAYPSDGGVEIVESHRSAESHELVSHADNTEHLYKTSHVPVAKNLEKKFKKGTYDHEKAKKLWKYHADRSADSYAKEHGSPGQKGHHIFSVKDRHDAASHFADRHHDEMKAGNFHEGVEYADIEALQEDYAEKFQTALKASGKTLAQMSDDEKKAFFKHVDSIHTTNSGE
jgi:hypothetical protein